MSTPQLLKPTPDWEEHEKPTLPGSASMPWHPPHVRVAYALVALLVGVTGGLGNALVSANLPAIQGTLGLTPAESAWLPAAYVMVNVTINLIVFKVRQQYGLRMFAEIGLALYAGVTLLHLVTGGFEMAVLVRAVSGFAGAATSTLALLYMLQAAPRAYTGKMVLLGIGVAQLATPLAWMLSPGLLEMGGQWHNLYLFEAGLALCSWAAVVILKLPPGIHIKVFEPLDFVTFALMAPAVAMIVAVLAQGYTRWWFDTPWLAWLLIAAVLMLCAALFIEHHRPRPLLQTRWLVTGPMIRFMIGGFLIRFLTSEQTVGAVGLLRTLGMGPDQMQGLFTVILAGTVFGIVLSAASFSPKTIIPQILAAIVMLGVAATLDYGRTSLDRPHDFYLSQFLVAAGAGMFTGPLVMIGITQALKRGADHVITFSVMLAITQSLGGFAGSAVMSTYQLHREHVHSSEIVAQLNPADPVVAQRLRLQQQVYQGVSTDPALRGAQGVAQLALTARREANVLAYNDVFALSGVLALLFLAWSLGVSMYVIVQQRRDAAAATASAAPQASPNPTRT